MYRPPPPHGDRRSGSGSGSSSGGGFRHPVFPLQNPGFVYPGSLPSHVNLCNILQNPHQNRVLPQTVLPYPQNPMLLQQNASLNRHAIIQMIDAAARKAHQDLVAAGHSVSAWKVSQAALLALNIDAWSSLGFQIQDVPFLHSLVVREGKINTFIHCFLGARRITSLHDLEVAICKNEGIELFEELKLGPLLRHPLVEHYFSVPSDMTDILRITTEEIVGLLQTFMEKQKKMIKVDDFLDFLTQQKSLPSKEKLGVRIQSLGLHISYIREAKKEEKKIINKYLARVKKDVPQIRNEDPSQSSNIILQKKSFDWRFGLLSKRVQTFASENGGFVGKHIHFESSDSDEISDDDNDDVKNDHFVKDSVKSRSCHNKDNGKQVSSCPYPSTTEEMMRLGLKHEAAEKSTPGSGTSRTRKHKGSHGKKRKFEEKINSSSCKLIKKDDMACKGEGIQSFLPTSIDIEKFITTWKEACREHPFAEVLDMMLNFYGATVKQKKRANKIMLSYPGIGLMAVAIMSIKDGSADSLYDTFQDFGEPEFSTPQSTFSDKMIDIGPVNNENAILNPAESTDELKKSVTIDDIIKKVVEYSELENFTERVLPSAKILWSLKKFHNCDRWLATCFSVKEFSSLGYGNFFEFLEKYTSLLPYELYQIFNGGSSDPSPVHISLSEKQLSVMLSLANYNWMEEGVRTKNDARVLLKKQFPTISFITVGDEFDECFSNVSKCQQDNDGSDSVLFSAAMMGKQWSRLEHYKKYSSDAIDLIGQPICTFDTSVSENAIDCLLAAPMLSDLLSWSHWDLVYAPLFGSLIDWLLNGAPDKELLCIATRDGKLIKVDSSATVDDFWKALIQLSPFQVALKLLSLLTLYRGTSHAPTSLLKHYAQQAMEIIIGNSIDASEIKVTKENLIHTISDEDFCVRPCSDDLQGISPCRPESMFGNNISEVNKASSTIARFILECLGLLPSEFWSFAADILVSGFQFKIEQAPLIILKECNQPDQHFMLHEIGLSLGVNEWVQDYRDFCSKAVMNMGKSKSTSYSLCTEPGIDRKHKSDFIAGPSVSNDNFHDNLSDVPNEGNKLFSEVKEKENDNLKNACHHALNDSINMETGVAVDNENMNMPDHNKILDARLVVEAIRREEFGLDCNLADSESCLLKKQHARLGRALHCLSQELYSQDSHLLLELVQNADDNVYSHSVEPTLFFILHETGIIVLNNEVGFSADNIRALCDIGNSTKKGSSAGYIGHKGIGFKSVFRVTDAPEIHSNGFHIKFDITEGQVGFVLPTNIPPCDSDKFRQLLSGEDLKTDLTAWNTCIVLPFRSKLVTETTIGSIVSMFSDLHPSLLLFLHRLQCIRFKNILNNTSLVMRRETMVDGIVKVSHGNETMSWLVVRKKLQASVIRHGVQTTEIAVAFTLLDSECGEYRPFLSQQPAFAFLPLRNYGLKFILQGDFILPSSREEVDGDSAWNQWLLSEFPDLFVNAEQTFCSIPCYQENPAKAVTAYMSFVPLAGEVHGFFAHLPHMIISKLRMSNCLLLDGASSDWVLPCRTLRGWDEQVRTILPDRLLQIHLGLGYLNKDIILSDTLAKTLGVLDYGPKVLIDFMSSLCRSSDGIKSLGLDWLASWFIVLHSTLSFPSFSSVNHRTEPDLINALRKIRLIPLMDGSYGSISDGPIWLPCDIFNDGFEGKQYQNYFPRLFDKLRTVNSSLFSAPSMMANYVEEKKVENLIEMLCRIGARRLSAHEIIKNHILVAFSDEKETIKVEDHSWMIEYLSFIMVHLQFPCANCLSEKGDIIAELRKRSIFLTNDGYKCPDNEPIHFSKEYGNSVNINKLIGKLDLQWLEVDVAYLNHPSAHMLSSALKSWRGFFEEFGVTDFVQVNCVKKHATDVLLGGDTFSDEEFMVESSIVNDWKSPELDHMISTFALKKSRDKCIYLLEVLDKMWDNFYSTKAKMSGYKKPIESTFMKTIRKIRWFASTMDLELHESKDLFYYSEELQSLLGNMAPYAVPQLTSKLLLAEIGFKTQLSYDDACPLLHYWRTSKAPFVASVTQMLKFYSFISDGIAASRVNFSREFISSSFIFVPFVNTFTSNGSTSSTTGTFLSPNDVFWIDPTGCIDKIKEAHQCIQQNNSDFSPCQALSSVYPGLRDFFIQVCHVHEVPSFGTYLQILQRLSSVALPSQAASAVFRVFLRWSDDLKAGLVKSEEIFHLKNNLHKLESTVLPTMLDKWVSLHPSFGLMCWADDEGLKQQFKHSNGVDFLHFGELNNEEKEMLSGKVARLFQKLGIPALSQVVSREAIFYGARDNREKMSLINWVLPYAQRYIYKLHQDKYLQLKLFGLEKLSQLQILVVEELFYKHSLKGCDATSKKRFECNCLLQDNVFYTTPASDPHSIFLEFSRFFFDGSTELHFANFLHMITTMAESGSTIEQTEFFIVNSQKIPGLPKEEPLWSLSTVMEPLVSKNLQPTVDPSSNVDQNASACKKKPGIFPSWPPTDWKTAPDFSCGRTYSVQPGQGFESYSGSAIGNSPEASKQLEVLADPIEVDDDWIVEGDLASKDTSVLQDSKIMNAELQSSDHCNAPNDQVTIAFGDNNESADPSSLPDPNSSAQNLSASVERDSICLQLLDDIEARRIGRLGEIIAYKYLTKTLGPNMVKWVNEQTETGSPYDLIIGDGEYVEVKTTRYASRNWFEISAREWQCASELGDSFSIAHVALSGEKKASITIFKNPRKLCYQRTLRLALFMSRQVRNQ